MTPPSRNGGPASRRQRGARAISFPHIEAIGVWLFRLMLVRILALLDENDNAISRPKLRHSQANTCKHLRNNDYRKIKSADECKRQIVAEGFASSMPDRRFPRPWTFEEAKRLLHREGRQQLRRRFRLFRVGARPTCRSEADDQG
jgi:hypothetical protein